MPGQETADSGAYTLHDDDGGGCIRAADRRDQPRRAPRGGEKLENDGRLNDAVAEYRQILDKDPGHVGAQLGIGRVLDIKGRYAEARRHFQTTIDAASKHADEVRAVVGRGTLEESQTIQYPYVAGYVAFYQRDYERAIADRRRPIRTTPSS